jgi:hypothetical protein
MTDRQEAVQRATEWFTKLIYGKSILCLATETYVDIVGVR